MTNQTDIMLDFSGAIIWIGSNATSKEAQAARELQTFLYSISRQKLAVSELKSGFPGVGPAIILGTLQSLPSIAGVFPEQVVQLGKGSGEAFDLKACIRDGSPIALILANEPIGALYGAYTFLEKFGIGFYLGGDAFPGSDVALKIPEMDEFWNPAFPIRGSVCWPNFLNGPMTWDLEDYKYYFDQMVKMKANLVHFPEYFCGFTNYLSNGKLVPGNPLGTSVNNQWGTVRGLRTDEFGFGTGEFFTAPVYGSKATVEAVDDQDGIRRSQSLMSQAIYYAAQRGIKACLGFQLDGAPDETNMKDVAARLNVIAANYPEIEYVWFWQVEGGGDGGIYSNPGAIIPEDVRMHMQHFDYLSNEKQALEGARMTTYIQKAYDILKAISPHKRVVVSGWGGDKWCHFTDMFPGLDQTLPKDIILSALDDIDPSWEPNVSQYYGKVAAERECWAIPWWESDGGGTRHDQFMPQCNTHPFSELLPDILRKRCKGLLGIHWRVRDVEDVAAYSMDFAWNPAGMNYESFWFDYAVRCFGETDALKMSCILMELDGLGPRWTGGGGQRECFPFEWMNRINPKEENLYALARIKQQLLIIAENNRKIGKTQFLNRLERLVSTIHWVTIYDDAAMQIKHILPGGRDEFADIKYYYKETEVQVKQAQDMSADEKAAAALLLEKVPLGQAMQSYTKLLCTQGDWGVLSAINDKAYASFEKIWEACSDRPVPGAGGSVGLPLQIAFKEPNKIVFSGESVPVQIIVTGGEAVSSVMLYHRPTGEGTYMATPMLRGYKNVFGAVIPATAAMPDGFEYFIEIASGDGRSLHVPEGLPSIAVSVVQPGFG
jgi:hypothetical protein